MKNPYDISSILHSDETPITNWAFLFQIDTFVGLNFDSRAKGPSCYFLIDKDIIVYVGGTNSTLRRIGEHPDKVFDRVLFIPTKTQGQAFYLEEYYKELLDWPKYNKPELRNRKKSRKKGKVALDDRWDSFGLDRQSPNDRRVWQITKPAWKRKAETGRTILQTILKQGPLVRRI